MPDLIALAEALRRCPSIDGRVSITVELATQIEEALREAGEFVRVPRLEEGE